ncbi:hypothetical protein PMAYCL1PPCAC_13721 [Pristionchus mayeri]|uniref:Uncharacterized protein n=1 Tax=Pristionchus mayeri TaxID=1317129 RepID=A0AAN4ZR58_9BILA|nr:hypothetical protein PMAYCL1PPCAC_13721 [Pristionchus mayeri]
MERRKNCGKDGYLVHYGLANCERFSRAREGGLFDEKGNEWITCTRECLAEKLIAISEESPSLTCAALEKAAFDTHVPCYLQCHFCSICKNHKWALFSTYRIADFLNANSVSQVLDIIAECGLSGCFT